MSVKFLFVFCTQFILQYVQSQCAHSAIITASPHTYISTVVSPSSISPFSSYGCPEIISPTIEVTPTTSGTLPVTCVSAILEEPLTVESENVYKGTVTVNGELPFVGTVSLSGELPTTGTGAVNHACGSNARTTKELIKPAIRNSVASNAIACKRGLNNALVAPASPIASNADCKRGLGSRLGSFGFGVNSVRNTGYEAVSVANAGYGGTGEGSLSVVGELPVAGNTVVVGQVPIIGAVYFSGNAPAYGTVSVYGSCSCGCDRYLYKIK